MPPLGGGILAGGGLEDYSEIALTPAKPQQREFLGRNSNKAPARRMLSRSGFRPPSNSEPCNARALVLIAGISGVCLAALGLILLLTRDGSGLVYNGGGGGGGGGDGDEEYYYVYEEDEEQEQDPRGLRPHGGSHSPDPAGNSISAAAGHIHRHVTSKNVFLSSPEAMAQLVASSGVDPKTAGPWNNPPLDSGGRGYGRTQPLLEPQHLGSTLSALGLSGGFRQRWKGLRIAELGAQLLGSANRLALRHPHRFAQPATAADRARILEALPGIEKPGPDSASGCKTWDYETLIAAAEAAVDSFVESRYWACFIIKTALNAKTDQLAGEIGLERAFLTAEFRFFTRDITRFSMVASESQCQRKWGSKVGYLGAGAYGLAYIRCIDADGHCPDGARAVLKMAGLPPWDTTRETFKLHDPKLGSLPPWGGQYGLELSEKSLALGYDTSPESFVNEALRVLIATKVTPNIAVGYGSWVCDDFAHKTSLLPRNLNCKQRNDSSLSAKERKAACDNIIDDVKDHNMGPNMQILAQEEVEIGLEEAWGYMFHRFNDTGNEVAWAESNKAVLFQTIYTMVAIQKHIPTWRHNDMSWYNIRTTLPSDLEWELRGLEVAGAVHNKTVDGDNIRVPGSMAAPLQKDGTAATHFEYTVGDIQYNVPNYGFNVRIADFDFANSDIPRMQNPKVTKVVNHTCAKEIDHGQLWKHETKVKAEKVVLADSTAKDYSSFKDHRGRTCDDWAKVGCRVYDFGETEYAAEDRDAILAGCPATCGSPGWAEFQIEAPADLPAPAADNQKFTDPMGYNCSEWGLDPRGCDKAHYSYNFQLKTQKAIIDNCPASCMSTHAAEKTYMIQITRSRYLVDGPYQATVKTRGADGVWTLRIALQSAWAMTRVRHLHSAGEASSAKLSFSSRPWFRIYSLKKSKKTDGNLKFEAVLDGRTQKPWIIERDLLQLYDNDAATTRLFQVRRIVKLGKNWRQNAACKGQPCESVNPAFLLAVTLDSIRFIAGSMHEEKSKVHLGGFGHIIAHKSTALFYDYAKFGITPVPNEKFDMHFMLNLLLDHVLRHRQRRYIHQESKEFVKGLFVNAGNGLLARGDSTNTYDYRMSTNLNHWLCHLKGAIRDDDRIIQGFPTPLEMLALPMFDKFRRPAAGSVAIESYSINNTVPEALHVGTGELK